VPLRVTVKLVCIYHYVICIIDFSANNFAMQHKRKTISGPDVLDAMKEMEFERFVEPLKRSLECEFKLLMLNQVDMATHTSVDIKSISHV
jgi:hypothetical protein